MQSIKDVPVSAVAVTWNGRKYAERYVQSLHDNADSATEMIVVDNASSDGTPEAIASRYPHVTVIRNDMNLGFAKATNIGLQASTGRYICLINSDVVLRAGCIAELVRCMELPENRDVGLAGPQMLGADGAVRRSTMRFPTVTNEVCRALGIDRIPWFSRLCHCQLMSDFRHDSARAVDVLNGWFWIVRREALNDVGPLDERFFMYGEDVDWCFRFWKNGWRVLFCPEAKAIHYGGGSSTAAPVRFYVEMQKANLQYWRKHHGRVSYCLYYCVVCCHHLLRVLGHSCVWVSGARGTTVHRSKARRSWTALMHMLAWKNGKQYE